MNYFRDDPEIFKVIYEFASMETSLKKWPYAGALVIEKAYLASGGDTMFFRMLLDSIRSDNDMAWNVFDMMRKK